MRKIMCTLLCVAISSIAWSQDLHVASGGSVTIKPSGYLFAGSNVEVDAAGSLTAESDATNSASFLAAAGTITGNVSYKRHLTGGTWTLVSAPATGQMIGAFATDAANSIAGPSGNGNYAVAYYKESNDPAQRWTYHNPAPDAANEEDLSAVAFASGQGYSTLRTASGVYNFEGAMADADVSVSIPGTVATNVSNVNWYPVGNPFPSFLPANNATSSVLQANLAKLDPEHAGIYIWDGAAYVVKNFAGSDEQLHPGQAFMVKAASGGTDSFLFAEALQTIENQGGATNAFYNRSNNPTPNVVVNLTSATNSSSTELKYFSNTTLGLDAGWDAAAYRSGDVNLSIDTHLVNDSQGTAFMLQCLPDANYEGTIIPLAVKASAGEEISFSAVANNLPEGVDVYLEDVINNTIEKINDASYTITLDNNVDGIGNFYLRSSANALSIDEVTSDLVNMYKTTNSNLRITGLQNEGTASLNMFTITGQEVLRESFTAQRVNDVALPSLQTGVYIVQLLSVTNEKYTKKIIIE